MSDLIEHLRQIGCVNKPRCIEAADRIAELEAELAEWKAWGIVEIAARNPRVMEYVGHWEGRCLKAEAANAKMKECLEAIEAQHDNNAKKIRQRGAMGWGIDEEDEIRLRDFAREGLK